MQKRNSGRKPFQIASEHSKRASATKAGPGRYHQPGHSKDTPIKSKGAPRGFVLHKASPERALRRQLIRLGGFRQFRMERNRARTSTTAADILA